MKLTASSIRKLALPAGKSEAIFFCDDLPGFGYRLRGASPPTWVFQFKHSPTVQRRLTLGRVSAMGIATARKEAEQLYARTKLGEDVINTKRQERAKSVHTLQSAVAEYLDHQRTRKRKNGTIGLKPRSLTEVTRYLNVQAAPLHRLELGKVTRADIANCVRAIHKNSGPRAGNLVRATLSAFYTWAIENAKVDTNPVIGTPKEEEASRDRVLLPAELRAIWVALADDHFGSIMKLLLLTLMREGEVGGLRRSELHGDFIILPSTRTKNAVPHVVPLSPLAQQIIADQPIRSDSNGAVRDLLFGLRGGPFARWSAKKKELDAKIAEQQGQPLAPWRIHDLRRTGATLLSGGLPAHLLEKLSPHDKKLAGGLKTPPHVREAILNHVSGYRAGVSGVYDRSTYEVEKRQALDAWALRLMEIVEGSNVTPLRREA